MFCFPDLKFDVYYRDEKTASVCIQNGELVYLKSYSDDMFKNPFTNINTLYGILDYISSRSFPSSRNDTDIMLQNMGLTHYNVYDIVKKSHGVDFDDFVWFKFEDDDENLRFKDVHLRG